MADYVYRNADDTVRYRIFQRHEASDNPKPWDFDIFKKESDDVYTYSLEAGEYLSHKRVAKKHIEDQHESIFPLGSIDTVTQGWPQRSSIQQDEGTTVKATPIHHNKAHV